jgi:uncharacterized damage-inducible protein DinB
MDAKELFFIQKEGKHQGTISVYSRIPPDHLDWRPAEGMLSLGQMALHVWMSEEGTRRIALDADWSYSETRIPKGLFTILGGMKLSEDELHEIQRLHQETPRAAHEFPLDRWDEIRENALFHTRKPVGVLLFRIIEHQVHHRAQVGTYLRILTGERASPYAV